jgi:hypothetical protein
MSSYKHRRTTNPATAFPALQDGEIAVNTANRQLAVGDPMAGGTAQPFIAVRVFSTAAQYAIGDYAVQGGQLYRAKAAITPGAFSAANWDAVTIADVTKAYVDAADSTLNTSISGKLSDAPNDGKAYWRKAAAWAQATGADLIDATVTFAKLATAAIATTAEFWANTASKILTTDKVWAAAAYVTVTDAAAVTLNLSTGIDFLWTLGAAGRTMNNPTNGKPGQRGIIWLIGTSGSVTTWGTNWHFPGGVKPTTTVGVDMLSYVVGGDGAQMYCSYAQDVK